MGQGRSRQNRGPRGWERSDERIKEDLCERIADSDDIDASDVTVEVRQGVVTLDGTVYERWTRYSLEDLADSVPGVKDVQNNVRLSRENETFGSSGQARSGTGSGSSSSGSMGAGSATRSSGSLTGSSGSTSTTMGTSGTGSTSGTRKE
jgi:hypothetical protein